MILAARVCGSAGARSTVVVARRQTSGGGIVAATTAEDGRWGGSAASGSGMIDANHDSVALCGVEMLGWWRWRENVDDGGREGWDVLVL